MRRLILVSLIFVMVVSGSVALALDTSDAIYTGMIRITNNGTAATNVSVPFTANTTVYINAGYMNSSANNTAITSSSGANVPYQPGFNGAFPWSIFVPSIGANNIQNDTLFMGGTTDMEGKIRYFPGASGMTVADSASLELGDNFTIEMVGFFDTDTSEVASAITFSPDAHPESDSVDGTVLHVDSNSTWAQIRDDAGTSGIDDGSQTFHLLLISNASTDRWDQLRRGIYLFDTSGLNDNLKLLSATVSLYGTAKLDNLNITPNVGIYASSPSSDTALGAGDYATMGDTLLSDQISFANWDTAGYNVFTLNADGLVAVSLTDITKLGARFVFDGEDNEPTWVSAQTTSFSIAEADAGVNQQPILTLTFVANTLVDKTDAINVLSSSGNITVEIIGGNSVSAMGVTTGEHTVLISSNITSLSISIDGVESDNATKSLVPDNGNTWTLLGRGTTPYVKSVRITVGGTLQGSWTWQYSDTFTDASGNSHDATPSFRTVSSDAEVSAELITFSPITEARAPAFTANISTTGWITDDISQTGNFTAATTNTTYPGSEVLVAVTTAGGVPLQLLELLMAGMLVLSLSLFISWMLRSSREGSIFFKILVITAGLGIMIAVSIVDNWILYLFLMISIAIAMGASQRTFTGTGNSGNNMIGFLAMAFVGMTTINRILEGRFIQSTDVDILRNTLAFQPFEDFGLFTIPVPNTDFLLNGIPALLRWDYSFFGGNAQIFQYMLYSVTAVVSFMLFVLVFGAIYQMFNRR